MEISQLILAYGNSVIYATGTALFSTWIAIPTGYALARWKSIWMKILFWCCVVLLFLPFQVTMLPQYILLDAAGLLNTRWAILVPGMFSPLPVLILWIGNQRMPQEYEDAFLLESSSLFSYFCFVLLPDLGGLIAAAFAVTFLLNWNMVDAALIFLEDSTLWPLSLALMEQEGRIQRYYVMLDMVPSLVGIAVLFVLWKKKMQKKRAKG